MVPKVSSGTCLICRAPITKRKALNHGMECLQTANWPTGKKPSLIIMVQGQRSKKYWLIVLARHDALLGDIDQLIRDVWVECCEHLSSFRIGGAMYDSDDEHSTDAMAVPLADLVFPDSTFSYDYDFGSTTSLDLKVIGETPVTPPDTRLCLIARNNLPTVPCDICGDKARFILGDPDEENAHYYCSECLESAELDPEYVDIISNSPRDGICGYVEDPIAALSWYPSGWGADEIVPEIPGGIQKDITFSDEMEVDNEIAAVVQDIGSDIDAFVEAEKEVYGEEAAGMAGVSVMAFCTFMYGLYGKEIGAWDVASVQSCLVENLSQNPVHPEDWPENAVPALCRFLTHMEASGRLTNASELITALKDVEFEFQEEVASPEKSKAIFRRILMEAEEMGVNTNDLDEFAAFAVKELATLVGFDLESEEVQDEFSGLIEGEQPALSDDEIRTAMIFILCEDFCSRFDDETVLDRCKKITEDLFDHPATPLSRGDVVLWSAAIVYTACQDLGLIRPGKGGSPRLVEAIGLFFGFERSSIRNKAAALKKFLPVETSADKTYQSGEPIP